MFAPLDLEIVTLGSNDFGKYDELCAVDDYGKATPMVRIDGSLANADEYILTRVGWEAANDDMPNSVQQVGLLGLTV